MSVMVKDGLWDRQGRRQLVVTHGAGCPRSKQAKESEIPNSAVKQF